MEIENREKYYADGETRVTDPLIMTKCRCGHEFWRTRKHMTVTCRKCGNVMNTVESERCNSSLNLD